MQKDLKIDKPTTFVEVIKYDEEGNRLSDDRDRNITEEYRLTASEVRAKLENITDEDAYVLGVDTTKVKGKYIARPEWMVLTVLPVPPVTVRPSITLDTGER